MRGLLSRQGSLGTHQDAGASALAGERRSRMVTGREQWPAHHEPFNPAPLPRKVPGAVRSKPFWAPPAPPIPRVPANGCSGLRQPHSRAARMDRLLLVSFVTPICVQPDRFPRLSELHLRADRYGSRPRNLLSGRLRLHEHDDQSQRAHKGPVREACGYYGSAHDPTPRRGRRRSRAPSLLRPVLSSL